MNIRQDLALNEYLQYFITNGTCPSTVIIPYVKDISEKFRCIGE
jgi:hypothetical protein